ncbi:hypothetical protein ACF1BS_21230 [Streptomyces sp. NPDC014748]|uniref:hypothetical protein n=1 Tax=Streptomyces sp. NPDC014748 TaxID=3364905 RepID=UPI0036FD2748
MNDLPGAVGRLLERERERELDLLTAPVPDSAVTVMTVDGTASVGMTTLVVHPAHRLRAVYPDGCLYVDLRAHSPGPSGRLSPQRVLPRLLRSLGVTDDEIPDGPDELTAAGARRPARCGC